MKETTYLKRRLKYEREVNAILRKAVNSARDGIMTMLRQKDELEAELRKARLELVKLDQRLVRRGH
jgi:hypothetical protein